MTLKSLLWACSFVLALVIAGSISGGDRSELRENFSIEEFQYDFNDLGFAKFVIPAKFWDYDEVDIAFGFNDGSGNKLMLAENVSLESGHYIVQTYFRSNSEGRPVVIPSENEVTHIKIRKANRNKLVHQTTLSLPEE